MSLADFLRDQPPPSKDFTSALNALRVFREVAIHTANFDEFMRLSRTADDLEAFIYSHASAEEMRAHLDKEGLDKPAIGVTL